MIKCQHCDVEAYYRFTIEDFNRVDLSSADLCINCIKHEAWKAINDFPSTKSLKIDPLFSILSSSTPVAQKNIGLRVLQSSS